MKMRDFKNFQAGEERRFVRGLLIKYGWACTDTALALGVAPTTLLSTVKRLGLKKEYDRKKPARGQRK